MMLETRVQRINRLLGKGSLGDQNGCAGKLVLFRAILRLYPHEPVQFVLRTNSINGRISVTEVKVKGLGDFNRVYCFYREFGDLFPECATWEPLADNSGVHFSSFVYDGKKLATMMGRELTIIHQVGGVPDEADYITYGPFMPDVKVS